MPETFRKSELHLGQDCFEAAEYLAPVLRSYSETKEDSFVGYVDVLKDNQMRMACHVARLFSAS